MAEGVSEHFSDDGRAAIAAAGEVARETRSTEITSEHFSPACSVTPGTT
ncbi:hypothetical protein FHR72_000955 [Mycolicibacterium iranicum]|uniref:Uncharacterized protein n=1 Tax=Mycolicibacterium iranicum TaxID=912594 RepID=A0A839Q8D8_MYCIR|nr:hypothetical protein [Mycolicibacterium iranicum]MBB2989492.1 hypothetical protein [Mycolicibacterium iranicum]